MRTTLFEGPRCHVFSLPEDNMLVSESWEGHHIWSGKVVVVRDETSKLVSIELLEAETDAVFGVCPYYREGGTSAEALATQQCVQQASDSSRCFVVRLEQGDDHAYIGLNFDDRNHAFQFNAALADARRGPVKAAPTLPVGDHTLRAGEKIVVDLGGKLKGASGGVVGLTAPPAQATSNFNFSAGLGAPATAGRVVGASRRVTSQQPSMATGAATSATAAAVSAAAASQPASSALPAAAPMVSTETGTNSNNPTTMPAPKPLDPFESIFAPATATVPTTQPAAPQPTVPLIDPFTDPFGPAPPAPASSAAMTMKTTAGSIPTTSTQPVQVDIDGLFGGTTAPAPRAPPGATSSAGFAPYGPQPTATAVTTTLTPAVVSGGGGVSVDELFAGTAPQPSSTGAFMNLPPPIAGHGAFVAASGGGGAMRMQASPIMSTVVPTAPMSAAYGVQHQPPPAAAFVHPAPTRSPFDDLFKS